MRSERLARDSRCESTDADDAVVVSPPVLTIPALQCAGSTLNLHPYPAAAPDSQLLSRAGRCEATDASTYALRAPGPGQSL